jgi:hypothetical protein
VQYNGLPYVACYSHFSVDAGSVAISQLDFSAIFYMEGTQTGPFRKTVAVVEKKGLAHIEHLLS